MTRRQVDPRLTQPQAPPGPFVAVLALDVPFAYRGVADAARRRLRGE